MRTNVSQGLVLFSVSALIFFTGSVLSCVNHWPDDGNARNIVRALAMAAFLTTAEIVFCYADFRFIKAKKLSKKIGCSAVIIALALSMSWVIASEWEAGSKEIKSKIGLMAVREVTSEATSNAASKTERLALNKQALQSTEAITKTLVSADVKPYTLNFVLALIGMVILHFCIEKPAVRRKLSGNVLPNNERLQQTIKHKLGFAPDEVKAYEVNGGYAVHKNGVYKAFVNEKDLQ